MCIYIQLYIFIIRIYKIIHVCYENIWNTSLHLSPLARLALGPLRVDTRGGARLHNVTSCPHQQDLPQWRRRCNLHFGLKGVLDSVSKKIPKNKYLEHSQHRIQTLNMLGCCRLLLTPAGLKSLLPRKSFSWLRLIHEDHEATLTVTYSNIL